MLDIGDAGPPSDSQLDAFVNQVVVDWRSCRIVAGVRALAEFAEQVTRAPHESTADHVETLRGAGWSDRAIHDAVQVIAYFNYINRVADALGVEPEADMPRWGPERQTFDKTGGAARMGNS